MHLIKKKWEVLDVNRLNSLVEEIKLDDLEKELSNKLETPIKLTIDIEPKTRIDKNSLQIKIYCKENLVKKSGVFSSCFRSVRLEDFGVKIFDDVEFDEDIVKELQSKKDWDALKNIETNILDTILYVTFDLRYYLKDGGSNGVTLLSASYNFKTKQWNF